MKEESAVLKINDFAAGYGEMVVFSREEYSRLMDGVETALDKAD